MKIFGVGLSKTGTTSLTEALNMLGLNAVHWEHTRHIFRYTETGIRIDWNQLQFHDAFTDTPVAHIYPELDEKFPDSKFILTVRDTKRWARSFRDQFRDGGLDDFTSRLHMELYGTDSWDEELCTTRFEEHNSRVIEYFRGREEDLLVMDITAGSGWGSLCDFLDLPEPGGPFPKRYTRGERKGTRGYRLKRRLSKLLTGRK